MSELRAYAQTENGAKYVRQLCNHWSHKFPVQMDGDAGVITFDAAQTSLEPDDGGIRIAISGADRDQLDRLKDVVAQHIDRFAFREAPLRYEWSRID